MRQFPLQTALTIAALACLLSAAPLVLRRLKGPDVKQCAALFEFSPEATPLSPLRAHPNEIAVPPVIHLKAQQPAPSLFCDSDGALDHFYRALSRTERHEKQAVTRIVHYGDSPTTADLITGDVRAMLQTRFGDAGHGFILISRPWAWYQHRDVSLSGSGWQILPASHFEAHDGLFGLGGVTFTGSNSAHSQIRLHDHGHSLFELYYLGQPNGGAVAVKADDNTAAEIPTRAETKSAGFARFMVEGGASVLDLRPQGIVRLFGITAEKPGPGVVYDSLGLNGASVTVLTRMFQQHHWAEELGHRDPDLVIINYGTNEADFAGFVDRQYEKELREAIHRIREAVPEASILVMSPMDRGHRTGPGEIETMETIPRIVELQRRVARETRCGFFDTFSAMGGAGTMARWYAAQPRKVSGDLIHPYPAAGRQIAEIFVKEIESGFARFKLRLTVQ